MSLYSNRLCIGITISRSSALPINVLLVFDIHDGHGALFFKISFLFPSKVIVPFTTIYASLYSHKSDLSN